MRRIRNTAKAIIISVVIMMFNIYTEKAVAATLLQSVQEKVTTAAAVPAVKNIEKIVDIDSTFIIRLIINLASVLLLILFIYYPNNKDHDYIFAYFIFNIIIFLLTYLMNQVKISMGAAFGLFAVFSMLRYRTEGITMKDMTYLFIVIALGLFSALRLQYFELAIVNAIILIITYLLDGNLLTKREHSQLVMYDNTEMVKPEYRLKLLEDLKERTGLSIHRVKIRKIDFLKDETTLSIYYYEIH